MADAVDYLGHPCQVTRAREAFAEMIDLARRNTEGDSREVPRRIGRLLNDLSERLGHLLAAQQAVIDLLPDDTDNDSARAVLSVAGPYGVETCDLVAELAGYSLLALELGGVAKAGR